MENNITVELKIKYGNELIYPVCDNAKLFAKLAGKITLNRFDIDIIKQLGYTIEVKQQSL